MSGYCDEKKRVQCSKFETPCVGEPRMELEKTSSDCSAKKVEVLILNHTLKEPTKV